MMSVHPEGGGSARDTRVLLVNADLVSSLIKCCLMLPFPTVVTALSVPSNPPRSDWGVGGP